MRLITWCLIGYIGTLYGLVNFATAFQAWRYTDSKILNSNGQLERRYFEGGIAKAHCASETGIVFLTVNGKNLTGEETWITPPYGKKGSDLDYEITLNHSTILGEYICHAPNRSATMHIIGNILCDPGKIVPEKECQKGEFCVINGSDTRCQSEIDCDHVWEPVECINKTKLVDTNGSVCSEHIPKGYYFEAGYTADFECKNEPILYHKGQRIEFYSTIPIGNSIELKEMGKYVADRRANRSMYCITYEEGMDHKKYLDEILNETDLGMLLMKDKTPRKTYVKCVVMETGFGGHRKPQGRLDFYILFYGKNRTRFSIVQKGIATDITNTTNKELLLDPTAPFKCTVSIDGGLFIEAFSMEANSTEKAKLGNDSVEMKYNDDPNAVYTCIAKIYYYEYFGSIRFKPLYTEKRSFMIYHSTSSSSGTSAATNTTTTTTTTTTTMKTMAGWTSVLIGVCAVLSVLVVALLIAVVVLGILLHRSNSRLKEVEERKSSSVMPVDASDEPVSFSTSAAESED